jgi:K+-transporting ATPase ATPase A chain
MPPAIPSRMRRATRRPRSVRVDTQTIPLGPAASQIAIKQLGTNGGGFFNANSAHPFENPTPLSNFLELLAILLIPAALCYSFGRMVGDTRQGWALLAAMLVLWVPLLGLTAWAEGRGNPAYPAAIAQAARACSRAATWRARRRASASPTRRSGPPPPPRPRTARSTAMHDSFTPIGGLIPMWLIQLGEVIFGGVGSGLYGMLVFAIIAVFIAGLMVGRTPEYLGKKLEAFEMKMASLVILIPPFFSLVGTAIAVSVAAGRAGDRQPRRAWLLGDPVRVLFGVQQ